MTASSGGALERALDSLPETYAGPGGAAAILRQGRVVASRSWGWADTERRIPFTPRTLFRICSITKQFTCSLVLDQVGDPAALDEDVRRALPRLAAPPRARDMCHNQSGLRDYWAQTVLCGSPVEGPFGPDMAARLIGAAASLQFAPGTSYSYSNQNFRLLGDLVAARVGRDLASLLRDRVFTPAGMETAFLAADTQAMPDGATGYEGSPEEGFRPAVNRIVWTGDAGIGASLDDMVAWESFIDATRDDPASLYRRLTAPPTFADGTPALYGFGVGHGRLLGRHITGHGGGLRGWRSYRFYAPAERVSVVVLFNHMADARDAAAKLFASLLDEPAPAAREAPVDPSWEGSFLEPETGLLARLEPSGSRVRLHYGTVPELIDPAAAPEPGSGGARLVREADRVWLERPGENRRSRLVPLTGEPARDIEGVFRCAELNAELSISLSGGVPYAAFSGFLGQGSLTQLVPVAGDVWRLPCPRALDYHAPGDWTLAFHREAGRITGLRVGCWLARGLPFEAARS